MKKRKLTPMYLDLTRDKRIEIDRHEELLFAQTCLNEWNHLTNLITHKKDSNVYKLSLSKLKILKQTGSSLPTILSAFRLYNSCLGDQNYFNNLKKPYMKFSCHEFCEFSHMTKLKIKNKGFTKSLKGVDSLLREFAKGPDHVKQKFHCRIRHTHKNVSEQIVSIWNKYQAEWSKPNYISENDVDTMNLLTRISKRIVKFLKVYPDDMALRWYFNTKLSGYSYEEHVDRFGRKPTTPQDLLAFAFRYLKKQNNKYLLHWLNTDDFWYRLREEMDDMGILVQYTNTADDSDYYDEIPKQEDKLVELTEGLYIDSELDPTGILMHQKLQELANEEISV